MCISSAVSGQFIYAEIPRLWPTVGQTPTTHTLTVTPITREEFDALKRDVEELKKLLAAAKEYDRATGQPDCENDEKIALLKALADRLGVEFPG